MPASKNCVEEPRRFPALDKDNHKWKVADRQAAKQNRMKKKAVPVDACDSSEQTLPGTLLLTRQVGCNSAVDTEYISRSCRP